MFHRTSWLLSQNSRLLSHCLKNLIQLLSLTRTLSSRFRAANWSNRKTLSCLCLFECTNCLIVHITFRTIKKNLPSLTGSNEKKREHHEIITGFQNEWEIPFGCCRKREPKEKKGTGIVGKRRRDERAYCTRWGEVWGNVRRQKDRGGERDRQEWQEKLKDAWEHDRHETRESTRGRNVKESGCLWRRQTKPAREKAGGRASETQRCGRREQHRKPNFAHQTCLLHPWTHHLSLVNWQSGHS